MKKNEKENIPIGECIHCHQNKQVKLGECFQCHQQKKLLTYLKQQKKLLTHSELMKNNKKVENIPTGECIHCYQEKPLKLGECYKCYQKRSNKFYSNKKECPECKKRITGMNEMINDKICTKCHIRYQRRFDNFNNQVMCKTCNEQNQRQEMYNEHGKWYCSLECMYAKKILDEIGDVKNIDKERIIILVNRFTSTNKNAGSTYNLTPKMIMEKLEISMKQNKFNTFDEIKRIPEIANNLINNYI
ncbi:hypothetical protein RclHR1_04940008 [Rhizophagus clarus]|uniref:Uncharacterized protein n=2 Tax=Rhizophagus clarus TaxID=94130 RepID=A0A2Z6RJK3_9GLOM|nr:hypothetical protein RclHR1_04940008 [Rhizophagus clarus]